jgi:predicted nicotinamide N-methyase
MSPVRIRYQTYEFDNVDIHVRSLRDKQQFSDSLGEAEALGISSAQWPLFGVIWESSEVLAHEMVDFDIQGKRILEVGCGMALSSLLLNSRCADITATDYHPEAGAYLVQNTSLNNGAKIPYLRTRWEDSMLGLGKFDVIIGADLLYERNHINLLSVFIDRHANASCEIIIVDPGRGNHSAFSKKMVLLGYSHSQSRPENMHYLEKPFKGVILRYLRH